MPQCQPLTSPLRGIFNPSRGSLGGESDFTHGTYCLAVPLFHNSWLLTTRRTPQIQRCVKLTARVVPAFALQSIGKEAQNREKTGHELTAESNSRKMNGLAVDGHLLVWGQKAPVATAHSLSRLGLWQPGGILRCSEWWESGHGLAPCGWGWRWVSVVGGECRECSGVP